MTTSATESTVYFGKWARDCATEFTRGYGLAIDWFTKGAPTNEADVLWQLYTDTRPGSTTEEATRFFDATKYPNLVAHLTAADTHLEVFDGEEYHAELVRKYGDNIQAAPFPKQCFAWPTLCAPMYEGFLLAVTQVMEE